MKLQRREKKLAYMVGGLLVAVVGWFLVWGGDSRTDTQLELLRGQLEGDVAAKQDMMDGAARDAKRLAQWRLRALPSDRAIAGSLYQNWLRDLAIRFHIQQLSIDPRETVWRTGSPARDMFTRMSFVVRGRVGLANLTQFLYEFYGAGHLHQIRLLDMKPIKDSRDLDVTLTVEAISLPDADRKDQLSKKPGVGLRLAKLDKYRDPIVKRDLFSPYTPPSSARPPAAKETEKKKEPTVDTAQFAFITGFTEIDGLRQVWIQDRTAGKVWTLNEGGEFKIGELRGTVLKIAATREVTLDFDGHRRRLTKGENLRGGVEVGVEVKGHGKN